MAGRVTVRIEGAEQLLERLRQLGVDVGRALEAAAQAGAEVIARSANARAPGPHVATETAESGPRRVTVDIGPDQAHWYYRFFETGATAHEITGRPLVFEGDQGLVITGRVSHPGMAARPFLRPALDSESEAARDEVGARLRRAIER